MDNKTKLLESLMKEALEVSTRSKDAETKVGALLVSKEDLATIATGYNGFIKGAPDDKLPKTRPEKYPYIVHAEENIICHCARRGISTANCILICTLSPCTSCLRRCWNAGIDTVYFLDEYRDFHKSAQMGDLKINRSKIFTDKYELSKIVIEPWSSDER